MFFTTVQCKPSRKVALHSYYLCPCDGNKARLAQAHAWDPHCRVLTEDWQPG